MQTKKKTTVKKTTVKSELREWVNFEQQTGMCPVRQQPKLCKYPHSIRILYMNGAESWLDTSWANRPLKEQAVQANLLNRIHPLYQFGCSTTGCLQPSVMLHPNLGPPALPFLARCEFRCHLFPFSEVASRAAALGVKSKDLVAVQTWELGAMKEILHYTPRKNKWQRSKATEGWMLLDENWPGWKLGHILQVEMRPAALESWKSDYDTSPEKYEVEHLLESTARWARGEPSWFNDVRYRVRLRQSEPQGETDGEFALRWLRMHEVTIRDGMTIFSWIGKASWEDLSRAARLIAEAKA